MYLYIVSLVAILRNWVFDSWVYQSPRGARPVRHDGRSTLPSLMTCPAVASSSSSSSSLPSQANSESMEASPRHEVNPKSPNLEKKQSRLKFSVSLENFKLDFQNSPPKTRPWCVARLKRSFSLKNFSPGWISLNVVIFGPSGKLVWR